MSSFTNCHGCTKRYPGCHSKCELYKADKAEYERKKALEDNDKAYYQYIGDTCKNGEDKAAKFKYKVGGLSKFN